ncbi:MAG: hypothetical protein PVI15_10725 [Chromatiales bacterium]|jgi:curli biogenesis system outer membrane secretion channel CsgG
MPKANLLLAALLTLGLLSACGQEPAPSESAQRSNPDGTGAWGEAGARDPLVEKSKTKEHQERIVERMLDVQADR